MVETPEDEATQDEQEEGEETIEETEDSSFLDDEATQDEQEEGEETIEETEDSSFLDDEATQDEQEEGEETIEEAEDGSSLDDEVTQDEQEEGEETVEEAEDSSSLDDEATQDEQEEGEETVEEAEDSSSLDDEVTQDEQEEGEETVEEVESSSLLASFAADLEFLHGDNMSFYQANKAYYEDQNYEEAIAEFQAAIEYEKAHPSDYPDSEDQAESMSSDEVIAKSMYWIGESYIKLNQKDQAVKTFRQLTDRYSLHYLAPAAQRRIASLRLDEESESA